MRTKAWAIGILAASLTAWAQAPKIAPPTQVVTIDQPDANRTREEFSRLLGHYPPTLRNVLAIDPSLLGDQSYLAPYPALATFLNQHPEIARDPQYYVGESYNRFPRQDSSSSPSERVWGRVSEQIGVFGGFAMAIGLLMWLIRTTIDYRRWNRLTNIQTNVHTKLLDRFTGNEELLAYIQSPAGSKFLESAPIALDSPRNVGAPMGRILWSVQAGLVLMAGGFGLVAVAAQVADVAAQPIRALGILGVTLGLGFIVSAGASYIISRRLGLIEPTPKVEPPPTLG